MKAAVFYSPHDLRVEERNIPDAGLGEVIIKAETSGLCPTDVKVYNFGSSLVRPPVVLGHEFSGRVHSVGEGVAGIQVGDRMAIPADASCGSCEMCHKGYDNLCEALLSFGYNIDGVHADYIRVPRRFVDRGGLFKLSGNISSDEASMAEPLACVLHAIEAINLSPAKDLVIIGDGPMGLMHIPLAKVYGAENIIVVGLVEWKLKIAAELGATHIVNATSSDPVDELKRILSTGADAVSITAVTQATLTQALKMVKKRGYVHLFAGVPTNAKFEIEPNVMHYNEVSLLGSSGYSFDQFQKALSLITSRRVQLLNLVSQKFGLADIHEAIAKWEDKDHSLKILIDRR